VGQEREGLGLTQSGRKHLGVGPAHGLCVDNLAPESSGSCCSDFTGMG
jgi:hypothetical protein